MHTIDAPAGPVNGRSPYFDSAADYPRVLLSDAAITDLRLAAKADPFRRRLLELQVAVAVADRAVHAADIHGDDAAAAVADLERAGLVGDLEQYLDQRADAFLAGLSLALDRRPAEVFDMLRPLVLDLLAEEGQRAGTDH